MKKQILIPGKRIIISGVLVISELFYVFLLLKTLCGLSDVIANLMRGISISVALWLLISRKKSVYTAGWIFFLLIIPTQSWFYFFIMNKLKNKSGSRKSDFHELYKHDTELPENVAALSEFLSRNTGSYPDICCYTKYYTCGENFYNDFIIELQSASVSIYLEYFIFNEGEMWDTIHHILRRKAAEGVDIRIIYDDMCSLMFSHSKISELRREGIFAVPFNRVIPFPDIRINQRDHRKIAVIDGITAFTGGINIADEYINRKKRFGYWKDSALLIKGRAVRSMLQSFAETWKQCTGYAIKIIEKQYDNYYFCENGVVLPFDDSPVNPERISKLAYIKLINNSEKYLYITTPYLIPDHDMITALRLASECGVDVRIITPFIPDKKSVHLVTRSYYMNMLSSGVRIFEYVPGFIHSKTMISDGISAITGTANIDYRSFYLLFENGVYMYKSKAVKEVENDFLKTLSCCREVTVGNYGELSFLDRKIGEILKIFSFVM